MTYNSNIITRRDRASALVAVVIFGAIISICAGFAYRSTIYQTRMAARSYDYLSALNVAEAGAERAVLELNRTTNQFTGWTGSDPKVFSEMIQDNNGQNVGEVVVHVASVTSGPKVTATGYIPNKANARLMRTVQLNTKTNTVASPWGEFGLFAYGNLTMSGGINIKSFLPTNVANNTQKAMVGAKGNITLTGSPTVYGNLHAGKDLYFDNNSITVTGAALYGGNFSYKANNYPVKVKGGITQSSIREPNRITPPVKPTNPGTNNNSSVTIRPLNGGGQTTNGIASGAALKVSNSIVKLPAPGTYNLSSFKENNNSKLEIVGTGEVKIFVNGDFDLRQIFETNILPVNAGQAGPNVTIVAKNAYFTEWGSVNVTNKSELNVFAEKYIGNGSKAVNIDPDSKMMISAGDLDFSGGASLNVKQYTNDAGAPSNLRLFASKTANFGAGAKVSGVLYAPDVDPVFSGGFDWWGAVIGNNITVANGANLGVDETLFTPSGGTGAYVTAWMESSPKKI